MKRPDLTNEVNPSVGLQWTVADSREGMSIMRKKTATEIETSAGLRKTFFPSNPLAYHDRWVGLAAMDGRLDHVDYQKPEVHNGENETFRHSLHPQASHAIRNPTSPVDTPMLNGMSIQRANSIPNLMPSFSTQLPSISDAQSS